MTTKLLILTISLFFGMLCCPRTSSAYLQPTHNNIAEKAARASILSDGNTLLDLGLKNYAIDDNAQSFANSVEDNADVGFASGRHNILQLIADGAENEDITYRGYSLKRTAAGRLR